MQWKVIKHDLDRGNEVIHPDVGVDNAALPSWWQRASVSIMLNEACLLQNDCEGCVETFSLPSLIVLITILRST